MTIGGWVVCILIFLGICSAWLFFSVEIDNKIVKIISTVVALTLAAGVFFGGFWYFRNTAAGQRAMTDQKSNFDNGLDRTITIYTADGEIIAQYTGKIDIKGNDGGYVLFDYEGKRYTYYNCFVESIANIDP